MQYLFWVILAHLGIAAACCAQSPMAKIDSIQAKFKAFEYQQVIALSRQLLARGEGLPLPQKIEIYRLEAIAHYALFDQTSARANFEEILKLDSTFVLDSLQNSPKIVQFFNATKAQHRAARPPLAAPLQPPSADSSMITLPARSSSPSFTATVSRSLIWPGWGHRACGRKKKGWVLSAAAISTASLAVFYTIDNHNKEVAYLNETDPARIDAKFNRYNSSYKLRNVFITSYALIWLYSQIDILSLTKQYQCSAAFSLAPMLIYPARAGLRAQVVF